MCISLYGIYFFVITALLLFTIGGTVYFLSIDYDWLIASVISGMHKNGLENKTRNQIFIRNRFIFLQRMSWR